MVPFVAMTTNLSNPHSRVEDGTAIISMCSLEHIDVWKLTSSQLIECTNATQYIVYVPEKQLKQFARVTPKPYDLRAQESLGMRYRSSLEQALNEARNLKRYGWYLQQFMKIEALTIADQQKLVIWDADCVPTREVLLFDEFERPVYMMGSERNPAYFENIKVLLGLERIQNFSFVIPGFPIMKIWVDDLLSTIESEFQKPWFYAIEESINFSLTSGFSETETLGTWIANKYPGQWTTSSLKWERSGQSRFGYSRKFNPEKIRHLGRVYDLDIVSFENWDLRGIRLKLKKIQNRFNVINSTRKRKTTST